MRHSNSLTSVRQDSGMSKPKPLLRPPFGEVELLDLEFDETDELVLDQPPLHSPRQHGRLIRMNIDPEDDLT